MMKRQNFQKGDVVRCANTNLAHRLEYGALYKVHDVSDDGFVLIQTDLNDWYKAWYSKYRFQLFQRAR